MGSRFAEWCVPRWFNTSADAPTLALLRGKVVATLLAEPA
jgi:hypothetical protein